MRNCNKVLLDSICDLNLPFATTSSQWVDECTVADAPEVKVLNYRLSPQIQDQNLLGGKTIDGPGCFQFALWNKWAPYMA